MDASIYRSARFGDGRDAGGAVIWIISGLLCFWLAAAALFATAGLMARPVSAGFGVTVLFGLPAILGYLVLRCWVVPVGGSSPRARIALPLLVLAGMLPVGLIAAGTGAVAGFAGFMLVGATSDLASRIAGDGGAVQLVGTAAMVLAIMAAFCVGGIVTGIGLWGTEALATSLLFRDEPAVVPRRSLARAHIAGAAAMALAVSGAVLLITQHQGQPAGPAAAAILLLLGFGNLPHCFLTWRAWRPDIASGRRSYRALAARAALVAMLLFLAIGARLVLHRETPRHSSVPAPPSSSQPPRG